MASVDEIFRAFGGPASLAKVMGVTTEHASAMRRRRSIPVKYWPAILRADRSEFNTSINNQYLIDAHASRELSFLIRGDEGSR